MRDEAKFFMDMFINATKEEALSNIDKLVRKTRAKEKIVEKPIKTEKEKAKIPALKEEISANYSCIFLAKVYCSEKFKESCFKQRDMREVALRNNYPYLSEIELHISGFFNPSQPVVIKFENDEVVKTIYEWDEEKRTILQISKEEFIDKFMGLNVGLWKKEYKPEQYSCEILDGEQWSLTVKWSFGKELVWNGSNVYPYNFEELCELFQVDWQRP